LLERISREERAYSYSTDLEFEEMVAESEQPEIPNTFSIRITRMLMITIVNVRDDSEPSFSRLNLCSETLETLAITNSRHTEYLETMAKPRLARHTYGNIHTSDPDLPEDARECEC
jgi:hypothetical protein